MPLFNETIQTRSRSEIVDITGRVQALVRQAKIESGIAVVYVPHTTAAVSINENADPDVKHDLLKKLDTLVPKQESYYRHNEENSDSHVKTSLVGPSVTLIIEGGRLLLGAWQGVHFCEFDGPRQRTYHVKLIASPD